ncbi:uncharacterized protein LOC129938965 [Eupeodes corollae]|uniref:uncharacterized protein LOC129938965 n=1 Tax=Eupeodes corollae TaxID=290404 RepID=UPI0024905A32|nr:uncharacterized protein LOC129938965 [Eupeodes corollae]
MSSSFIQIKPIGSHPMGMLPWHNPLTLSSSPDFPQARRRVSCNLFGRPERGAINETYRQEEKQRFENFQQRYSFDLDLDYEELQNPQQPKPKIITKSKAKPTITRPTIISTATNIAESRLSGGESLIEKELREHEMKLKQQQQQRKKTVSVNCNEKLVAAGDRIKSRNLKSEEHNTAAAARTFVDSSKCASGHGERPKPYARQQSSITDYYTQRKTVVCNNSRTTSAVTSVQDETTELVPHLLDESVEVEVESSTTKTTTVNKNESFTSSSSSSPSATVTVTAKPTHPQQCENESSQEQISLHTMTTDVSAELA